jgi:hypothetical protein
MNSKHSLVASLAGGLISLVLVNTPYVSLVNLLICSGFWIGPVAAVWIYQRLNGGVTVREAIFTGVLAGVWHGIFGMLLSPLGMAGAGGLLQELQPFMSGSDWTQLKSTLTGFGGLLFNLLGAGFDVVFGFLGGLIGGAIFKTRRVIA